MTTAEKDDKEARSRRYPTASEWAEAEALWATGDVTLDDLASIVGVSQTSVSLHMKKAGITKGEKADEHRKRVAEKVAETALGDISEHSQRIKETKDEHYSMAKGIAILTWNEIKKAKQERTPFGAIAPNLKSLEIAMNVITKAQQARWQVLGLDRPDAVDDNELPELTISELTAEEIAALRDRNFNNPLDFGDIEELDDETKGDETQQG